MVGSSVAQMSIPGEVFASNPARFNGRMVTLKNLELVKDSPKNGPFIGGPSGTLSQGAPGPIGSPTAPQQTPCRPPRGYSEVNIKFIGSPEFKTCFFMADAMKSELDRQSGHENVPIEINFRGDSRMGYHVTLYRLGIR